MPTQEFNYTIPPKWVPMVRTVYVRLHFNYFCLTSETLSRKQSGIHRYQNTNSGPRSSYVRWFLLLFSLLPATFRFLLLSLTIWNCSFHSQLRLRINGIQFKLLLQLACGIQLAHTFQFSPKADATVERAIWYLREICLHFWRSSRTCTFF